MNHYVLRSGNPASSRNQSSATGIHIVSVPAVAEVVLPCQSRILHAGRGPALPPTPSHTHLCGLLPCRVPGQGCCSGYSLLHFSPARASLFLGMFPYPIRYRRMTRWRGDACRHAWCPSRPRQTQPLWLKPEIFNIKSLNLNLIPYIFADHFDGEYRMSIKGSGVGTALQQDSILALPLLE